MAWNFKYSSSNDCCYCRPTFYTIYKRKTAEGFQALPYVIALLSSMLYIYYALLKEEFKEDATFLITINSFGCVVETLYISLFLFYAPKKARVRIHRPAH